MFSTLRKFIVLFLTMLQFIAPLVHAHESDHSLKQGLHVPGLEHYGADNKALVAQMKTLQHKVCVNGMIVGVDLGLKQNRTNSRNDSDSNFCLLEQAALINLAVTRGDNNYYPSLKRFVYPSFITSHSPRAPPAP